MGAGRGSVIALLGERVEASNHEHHATCLVSTNILAIAQSCRHSDASADTQEDRYSTDLSTGFKPISLGE